MCRGPGVKWFQRPCKSAPPAYLPLPSVLRPPRPTSAFQEHRKRRDFFLGFASDPGRFVAALVASQSRDLKVSGAHLPFSRSHSSACGPATSPSLSLNAPPPYSCTAMRSPKVLKNNAERDAVLERRSGFYALPWVEEAVPR